MVIKIQIHLLSHFSHFLNFPPCDRLCMFIILADLPLWPQTEQLDIQHLIVSTSNNIEKNLYAWS